MLTKALSSAPAAPSKLAPATAFNISIVVFILISFNKVKWVEGEGVIEQMELGFVPLLFY
jgi:hypothetical protein